MQDRREGGRIFNIGFWEVILVLLIAFLVVGPKDLPRVARWLGRMVRKARALVREVKKETGWDEIEKEYKDTRSDVNRTVNGLKKDLDVAPELKNASSELNKSVNGVKDELEKAEKTIKKATGKK